jgi:hypothetical protein
VLEHLPLSEPSRIDFRVLGFIEVPGDASRSRALLQSSSGQKISRAMSYCRYADTDFLECQVDGKWYGMAGASLVAHIATAIPVTLPVMQSGHLPLTGPQPAPAVGGEGRPLDALGDQAVLPAQVPGVVVAMPPVASAYDPVALSEDPLTHVVGFHHRFP